MNKPTLINIYGGPSIGKSIMAAALFVELKRRGESCEYIQEYPKQLIWEGKSHELKNQELMAQKQSALLNGALKNCPVVITDGPVLQGVFYAEKVWDVAHHSESIFALHYDTLLDYNVISIYLIRGDHKYEEAGRLQNHAEAVEIDKGIKDVLDRYQEQYMEFSSDLKVVSEIADIVMKELSRG